MLHATAIEKRFGTVRVLKGANLTLASGQVHALLGANGAGKSTLSKIIAGHISRDGGEIFFDHKSVAFGSPREALQNGIALVQQETSLAPDLSVLDNIFMPSFVSEGWVRRGSMRQRGEALLHRLGQADAISLRKEAGTLSSAQKQIVEIAKALALDAKLIILDEPTASLSPSEVDRLFLIVEQLRAEGHALVFVSHRLEEVFTLCDVVTVVRDGVTVAESVPTSSLSQNDIVRLMVGQELGAIYSSQRPVYAGESPVLLDVQHLASSPVVRDVSFQVRRGEIVGLAGLVGSGRSEIAETIFGLRTMTAGSIQVANKPYASSNPSDAVSRGIALVPEDRRRQSLIPDFSVRENLLLGHIGAARSFGLGYSAKNKRMLELMSMLDVPPARLNDKSILNLSGGTQQKIIIARWLLLQPTVLILDEPTKGIDVKARASIYEFLRGVARSGVAIVLISSDFEELIGVSDRLVVVSDGASVADLPGHLLDEEQLTLLAAPRTSMARTQTFQQSLSDEHRGYAFWGLLEGNKFVCLAESHSDQDPDVRIGAGALIDIEEAPIGFLFQNARGTYASTGKKAGIVFEVKNSRGHSNGLVGLVLPRISDLPAGASIDERITNAFIQEHSLS